MNARKHLIACIGLALLTLALVVPSAQAGFGIKSLSVAARNEDTTTDLQAGSRPYEFSLELEMNQDAAEEPEGTLRNLVVDLPPGMVGNPLAVPRCPAVAFAGVSPRCSGDTQVGIALVRFNGLQSPSPAPVYNRTPPEGVPGSIGFSAAGQNSFQEASLRSDGDFGLSVADFTIPTNLPIQSIEETIWGVPASPVHDGQRYCQLPNGELVQGCKSNVEPVPFLTLPTSCGAPLATTVHVESLQNPGVFESKTALSEEGGQAQGLVGCNALEFNPTISSQPTTNLADSPSGLDFKIHQPQNEGVSQVALAPHDEVQSLEVRAHDGNVLLSFKGQSDEIPFNASATAVQGALQGLSTIGPGNVEVSGGPAASEPLTITFTGALADQPLALIEAQPLFAGEGSVTLTRFRGGRPAGQFGPEPALSTAHLKDVTVTLPQGLTLNPSAANGLGACSEGQIGYQPKEGQIHFSKSPQSCPNAAKVGTLEVNSPLVDHKLPGAIYLAQPYQNPFGALLSIYLAIEDEQTGTIAKLAGKVTPDPTTGQLSARFTDNPQLPIEEIETHFFGGPEATLKTPLACGKYTTTSELTPWSTPEGADAIPSDFFETSVAAGGSGACPKSEAQASNKPAFTAGTIAPQAGAYSPFGLRLSRPDGSQRLTGIDATLPKGLTGKLAGIPYCSEAQINQAKSREAPNQGAVEQASPSCPLASEVGTVNVGAGAGITPLYVTGRAYLAGPYKGAPISLVIITPAVAGPFDLGAVVARTALYVNSESAQIHAVSDPLPSIIQGIPLDLRSIALKTDRPDFTLNPTSCDPTAITGAATALTGQSAALTSPFQVGGCSALKFKPKLAISLKGGTKRNKYPALRAVVTYPKKGRYANIASAQVTLPHSAFLEQAHIGTVCTRVQFAADQCPKASVYGFARAFTPLLDKPVEGPVYLRSSSHELPDLVAALEGQVNVDLVGRVDTGKGGGIRNTFEAAPDAPVSKFVLEMKGGKKGLLVNSENICRKPQRALVSYRAHNGDAYQAQPLIKNDCGKKAKHKGKGKKAHRAHR